MVRTHSWSGRGHNQTAILSCDRRQKNGGGRLAAPFPATSRSYWIVRTDVPYLSLIAWMMALAMRMWAELLG
jgi:hypothetical protein